MTPDRWLRLADLVPDALAVEPADRDAFLDRACVDADGALDPTLRYEAGRLAAAAEAADRAVAVIERVAHDERVMRCDVGLPVGVGLWDECERLRQLDGPLGPRQPSGPSR